MSLIDELSAEFRKDHIPDDAVTVRQFAEENNIQPRVASQWLYEKFLRGELTRERKTEGKSHTFYYWKPDDVEQSEALE